MEEDRLLIWVFGRFCWIREFLKYWLLPMFTEAENSEFGFAFASWLWETCRLKMVERD